jgi:hypothetical protein
MAECKTSDENGNSGDQAVEQVERAYGPDADEVEERPLNTEVSEGLVQAFVDPVATPDYGVCLHLCPSQPEKWLSWRY